MRPVVLPRVCSLSRALSFFISLSHTHTLTSPVVNSNPHLTSTVVNTPHLTGVVVNSHRTSSGRVMNSNKPNGRIYIPNQPFQWCRSSSGEP